MKQWQTIREDLKNRFQVEKSSFFMIFTDFDSSAGCHRPQGGPAANRKIICGQPSESRALRVFKTSGINQIEWLNAELHGFENSQIARRYIELHGVTSSGRSPGPSPRFWDGAQVRPSPQGATPRPAWTRPGLGGPQGMYISHPDHRGWSWTAARALNCLEFFFIILNFFFIRYVKSPHQIVPRSRGVATSRSSFTFLRM